MGCLCLCMLQCVAVCCSVLQCAPCAFSPYSTVDGLSLSLLLPPMRVIYSPMSYMSHICVYRPISIYKTGESNKDIYIYIYIYLVDLLSRLIYESYMAAHGGDPTLNIWISRSIGSPDRSFTHSKDLLSLSLIYESCMAAHGRDLTLNI